MLKIGVLLFAVVLAAYTLHNIFPTDVSNDKETKGFTSCIETEQRAYAKFWLDYEKNKPSTITIRDFDDSYELKKEDCYRKYSLDYSLFGPTLTHVEIINKVRDLESYIIPLKERSFEELPVQLQIEFAARTFNTTK